MKSFSISLPSSKSISARLLIVRHLANSKEEIADLSTADDTLLLDNAINSIENHSSNTFYLKNAGTTLRFLIALLSITDGRWILNADKRMRERPLMTLICVLRSLGADIKISNDEDILPIEIKGRKLRNNGKIILQDNGTSQFISALLLISPYIENGLEIIIPDNQPSMPYIDMTISLVRSFGGNIVKNGNHIISANSVYHFHKIKIEKDYSALAGIYPLIYAKKETKIFFPMLSPSCIQGDYYCVEIAKRFGISTMFDSSGGYAFYDKELENFYLENNLFLRDNPDLFPMTAVMSFISGRKTCISGLENLRYKESDRLKNIACELNKISPRCTATADSLIIDTNLSKGNDGETLLNNKQSLCRNIVLNSYDDHRLAMALSVFSMIFKYVTISNKDCVVKSFADFWSQTAPFWE